MARSSSSPRHTDWLTRAGHRTYVRGEGGDWYAGCEDCSWLGEWHEHASEANRDAELHRAGDSPRAADEDMAGGRNTLTRRAPGDMAT